MFKLLRNYTFISVVAVLIALVLLSILIRQRVLDDLISSEQRANVALTRAFTNTIWPTLSTLAESSYGLSMADLQARAADMELDARVSEQIAGLPIAKVKVYNLVGVVIYSSDVAEIGQDDGGSSYFQTARSGTPISELTRRNEVSSDATESTGLDVLSTYAPIQRGDPTLPVEGVFEIYVDVTSLLQNLERSNAELISGVTLIFVIMYAALFAVVRRANSVVQEQYEQYLGSEQRLRQAQRELEARIETRTRQMQTSADVGRASTSILEPGPLLHEVVNLITDRFGFYFAAVFTLNDTGSYAMLREATGTAGRLLKERGHRVGVDDESIVGAAISTRKPRIALDVSQEAARFDVPLLADTRSELALPLVVGEQVLGALDVQSTQESAFDGGILTVLQSLADQVAMALSNAQTLAHMRTALQTTTRLYEVSRVLFACKSEDEAYAALSNAQTVLPDLDALALYMITARDADGEPIEYALMAGRGLAHGVSAEIGRHYLSIQLPIARLVDRKGALIVRDVGDANVHSAMRRAMQEHGFQAMVTIPIVIDGRYEGFVLGSAYHPLAFREMDIAFMQSLAEQLSLVLSNVRLDAQMRAALERVAQLNRRLSGEAWRGYLSLRPDLVIDSGSLEPADLSNRVSAPIVVRGETIGELQLEDNDSAREWSHDDLELLYTIADEVALAIENARLIEQAQSRAARESQLNQIAEKIRQASGVEGILRVAAQELSQALDTSHANARLGAPAAIPMRRSSNRDTSQRSS
jgi:GAF domain-containing protein